MSCRPWEEPTPVSEPERPVTPTNLLAMTGPVVPIRIPKIRIVCLMKEGLGATKVRPPRHVLKYKVVKRWVTGERAVLSEAQIKAELEELMQEHMELSSQKRFLATNPLQPI